MNIPLLAQPKFRYHVKVDTCIFLYEYVNFVYVYVIYRIHNNNLSRIKKKKIKDYGQEVFDKYNLGKYYQNQNN